MTSLLCSQTLLNSMSTSDSELIIGIDPGTRITGYGIISVAGSSYTVIDYGCIRPPAKAALNERNLVIFKELTLLLQAHKPQSLSVETQYVHKNVQSALKLGMARGAIILAASLLEIPVFEYAPSKAKLAVVGNGKASKEQVQKMIQMLLGLNEPPTPEDAADALALAVCHSHTINNKRKFVCTNT